MDSPTNDTNHTLICTVTVVSGVSSSLVMVNWSREDSLSESPRVTISDQTNNGLQYTRMMTFSPILIRDRGQYICTVSVTGFDEADNSNSVMIVVNGKCSKLNFPRAALFQIRIFGTKMMCRWSTMLSHIFFFQLIFAENLEYISLLPYVALHMALASSLLYPNFKLA